MNEQRTFFSPRTWKFVKRYLIPHPGTLIIMLLLIASTAAWARGLSAPAASGLSVETISYQGYLADPDGNSLTGAYTMTFRLYDTVSGGTALWEEEWSDSNKVQVSDGLFNVMLGSLTAIPQGVITGNDTLYLGISVNTDDEMAPRVQLGSVPFATQAQTVPDGSITTGKIANNAITSTHIIDGAVGSSEVADNALTANDLAANSVGSSEIANGAVGSSEVSDNALTANDLADNSVGSSEIASGAVGSSEVKDSSLTANDLAANSVGASEIANGAVTQDKFSDVKLYVAEDQITVDANGEGCKIFNFPSGRFTNVPSVFIIRSSIGTWEDNSTYARARFIQTTQRSTSSAKICVDDDTVGPPSGGNVGVAILAIQVN